MKKFEIDVILQEVITEAKNINIPLGNIYPVVKISTRTTKRLGQCSKKGNNYFIQVSSFAITEDKKAVRETLAHEILHTCYNCMNHGELWKMYANKMNKKYGYNITRTKTIETAASMGVIKPIQNHNVTYTIKCQGSCGQVIHRHRKSKLTQYPYLYKCGKCGGKLVLI